MWPCLGVRVPDCGAAGVKGIIWLKSMTGTEVTVWLKFMWSVGVQVEVSTPVVLTRRWAFMRGLRQE